MARIEVLVYFNSTSRNIYRISVYCGNGMNCEECPYKEICDEIYKAILSTKYAEKLRRRLEGGKDGV